MRTLADRLGRLGTTVLLATRDDGETVSHGDVDATFLAASVSKLFTHALAFAAIDAGTLSRSDRVADVLADGDIAGIHTVRGVDHVPGITVGHLLDQTSGLANPEFEKVRGGTTLFTEISRRDRAVDWPELADRHRALGGKAAPGAKAHYSDANALLLARILETVTGSGYAELLERHITAPLGLGSTALLGPDGTVEGLPLPMPVRSRRAIGGIGKYAASQAPAGGVVTTARDLMRFSVAFHGGELFDRAHVEGREFRRIQFVPLGYGAGMMRLELPRIVSPVVPAPEILGHSGSTGSFAFRCPSRGVHVVGTLNRIDVKPFEAVYRAIRELDEGVEQRP